METPSRNQVFFFVLLLALHPSKNSYSSATDLQVPKSIADFIRTSCTATRYPELCFKSLSSHASKIQTSPALLAGTAIDVALSSAASTSDMMVKLQKSKGLSLREMGAVKDCVEELSDSMDELTDSLKEMGKLRGPDFDLTMSNIQTWVSAALTDEYTCTEGFAGKSMDGAVKTAVRQQIENIAHLTSNALALINRYAEIHG